MNAQTDHTLKRRLGQCLLLSLWILISLGCAHRQKPSIATYPWFASLRENVVMTVQETDRARDLLILVDDFEQVLMLSTAAAEGHREELKALNADYDATREDFLALREKINTNNLAANLEVAEFRREMKIILASEEWEKIIAKQKTLFEMAAHQ
jgi:type IV pilus biogenesis protein CpaD/CtpE